MMPKIISWKSLPKWVYEQRVSDNKEDLPYWWREGSGENESCEFFIKFRPLPDDPDIDEINRVENGVVEIGAMSKHELLAALRAYKRDFNRFYDYEDYYHEYIAPLWKQFEYDRDHNGGPSRFDDWKKWKKAQKSRKRV